MSEAPMPQTTDPNSSRRNHALLTLTLCFILLGAGYGLYWWVQGRHQESTDDAYVTGNIIHVTPRINGTVLAVYADDTDLVQRGQLLARLDDADARVALASAEARLGVAVREVRQMFDAVEQGRANVAIKQENLHQSEADAARRGASTVAEGAVSNEEREHADVAVKRTQSELRLANSQLESAQAAVAGTTLEQHPAVKQAEAAVRAAFLDLGRCEIRAAETGFVARRTVQVGQQAAAGSTLMMVIPLQQSWIEANFKEDQLERMRIGQPVELTSDMYGSKVALHGKVAGLAAGTGSIFSLLPPQNATGNWIKIVQRLPVRVALDPAELARYPLRLGLSMKAEVDTSDASGEPLAKVSGSSPRYETTVNTDDEKKAAQRIREIIAANLGKK
jgi:membrane fusion protein (multidrug efflux system)